MKKLLFLVCVAFSAFSMQAVDLIVTHNTAGSMADELTTALGTTASADVTKLIVKGDAYLNRNDCHAIRDLFKANAASSLTLDFSAVKFENDSLPAGGSDTTAPFGEMLSLVEVKLPATLRVIGNRAFRKCSNLVTINFPATLKKVEEHAFSLSSQSKKLILTGLGNTVLEVVGQYAFYNNTNTVEPPTLPNTLKSVGANSFSNTAVNVEEFAEGMTTLGNNAFNCGGNDARRKITTLTFPSTMESIPANTFASQKNIVSLTFKTMMPPIAEDVTPFKDAIPENVTVTVPKGAKAAYEAHVALLPV